jgi:hypothetical protein
MQMREYTQDMKSLGPTAAVAAALLALLSAPLRPPAWAGAPALRPSRLAERLARGPVLFRWTELGQDEALDHHGGIWFLQAGERVYSVAWFERAQFVPRWPAVEGVGTREGDEIRIAFRNGTSDPAHDFYHASVHFVFDPDGDRFRCEFLHQASPAGVPSPGAARGVRLDVPPPGAGVHLARLEARAASVALPAATTCTVIPGRVAMPGLDLNYDGKVYRFCCPSCREVFQRNPAAFGAAKPEQAREK